MTRKLASEYLADRQVLTSHCIYTIKHSSDLLELSAGGGGRYSVGLCWVTGKKMVDEARISGERVPIIFAPAQATEYLFAWALLDDVALRRNTTTYSFSSFCFLPEETYKKKSLIRWNGKRLHANYIKHYAICKTPSFIAGMAMEITEKR